MRNGDRVVATPRDREQIDLAALAEAVLSMLATRPTGDAGTPVTVPSAQPTNPVRTDLADREEPAA
jgi:hypothetical protein